SHAGLGHEFDRDGEYSAWLAESRLYSGMARWALATELHAQHSALWATGSLAERKAVLLPLDLLAASYDDTPARADAGLVAGVHTTSTRPRSESAARVDVPRT